MKSLLAFQMGWCLNSGMRLADQGSPTAFFPLSIFLIVLAMWLMLDRNTIPTATEQKD